MADLVVRAILKENVVPELAKMAAAVQAIEKQMSASQARMHQNTQRHANRTNTEIFKIDNAMRGTARRMASRVLLIGGAIAAASGHAVALTAALWPMIGALGAIPAVTVGGIASIAGLITGFVGLGKAMQKTGGGSASSANQIAAAERRIEMANRSLRDSQEALNDAFEEARDRLRDIQTQYAGAQLDVEAAALAVREAELALREARSSGDRLERERADLALRQARLNQIEAVNRLSDVEQEYNERLAKGVEGSDEVRDATERHADALYELEQAQKALNEALKGGGGGGGDNAYAKLAPAAKELVDTLRRLAPAWREVRTETQQRLFAGVAGDIEKLSNAWLPVMLRQLPEFAQGWNNAFRGMAGLASHAGFVKDMDESLSLQATMWQRIGDSFAPFFSGFRHWVRIGSDFMPRLGTWIQKQAQRWELFSIRVRQTGEAHRWIENALTAGHKFNELIKLWGQSLFDVIRLGQDRTLIDRLIEGSAAFQRWLDTAEGQERITQMWERMRDVGSAAWSVIKEALDILSQFDISPIATALQAFAGILGAVSGAMGLVNDVAGPLITTMITLKIATLGVKSAYGLFHAATGPFTTRMADMRTKSEKAGLALKRVGGALTGIAIAGGAASAAFGSQLNPQMDALITGLERFNRSGEVSGELARLFGDDMEKLDAGLRNATSSGRGFATWVEGMTGLGQMFDSSWTKNIDRVKALDSALAQMVQAGNAAEAAATFEMIRQRAEEQGIEIDKLREIFPEYFGVLESGKGAQMDMADSVGVTAEMYQKAADNLQQYNDLLRAQSDPAFAFIQAQERVAQAQQRVNDTAAEFGEGSPQHIQALRDLQQATLDLNTAAIEAAEVDESTLIPQLKALEEQGLLAAGTTNALAESLRLAKERAKQLDGTRATVFVNQQVITTRHGTGIRVPGGGGFLIMHEGGIVPGQRGQEVAAVLQAGEKVTPLDKVDKETNASAQPVQVNVGFDMRGVGDELGQAIVNWLRKRVRAQANGNAQVFFAGASG